MFTIHCIILTKNDIVKLDNVDLYVESNKGRVI